jgi:hypothetical protein
VLHDVKTQPHQFLCVHGALQRTFSRVRARDCPAVQKLTPILAGRFASGDSASPVRDIELETDRYGCLENF